MVLKDTGKWIKIDFSAYQCVMEWSNKFVAVLVVLLCTLICEAQLANAVVNFHAMFYLYRRRSVGLLHAFSGPIRRIRSRQSQERTVWVRPGRIDLWWERFVQDVVVHQEWKENFRMHRETFHKLYDELRPFIERKTTNMRKPIGVEKQIRYVS